MASYTQEINPMETLIQKSIEGGYIPKTFSFNANKKEEKPKPILTDSDLMHPLFWQALSKACGWKVVYGKCDSCFLTGFGTRLPQCTCAIDSWKKIALRFYDINLTEGFDKAIEWLTNLVKE